MRMSSMVCIAGWITVYLSFVGCVHFSIIILIYLCIVFCMFNPLLCGMLFCVTSLIGYVALINM